MTDENLDKLMRKVLIDALRMEWSDALNESPTMSTTKEFQHQMKVMLRDPFAWYHKKTRPLWKKVLQTVATVVLVISLSFGTLMVTSPNARAKSMWRAFCVRNMDLYEKAAGGRNDYEIRS